MSTTFQSHFVSSPPCCNLPASYPLLFSERLLHCDVTVPWNFNPILNDDAFFQAVQLMLTSFLLCPALGRQSVQCMCYNPGTPPWGFSLSAVPGKEKGRRSSWHSNENKMKDSPSYKPCFHDFHLLTRELRYASFEVHWDTTDSRIYLACIHVTLLFRALGKI